MLAWVISLPLPGAIAGQSPLGALDDLRVALWGIGFFRDLCVWWGFYLIALGAGAWWCVLGPAVMSVLLLRVSGMTLLEKDLGERRPEYAEYVRRTNAFFPGPVRPGQGRSP